MEQELNIAAILKDKPEDTSLWSPIFGNVLFTCVNNTKKDSKISIVVRHKGYSEEGFFCDGRFDEGGECLLFPAKQTQDWSKFAWKKGDVLGFANIIVIFDSWAKDDYTEFKAAFECNQGVEYDKGNTYHTLEFDKVPSDIAQEFIKNVETHFGGTLNLQTLAIEKTETQFKDGDIVSVIDCYSNTQICIVKSIDKNKLEYYASTSHIEEDWLNTDGKTVCLSLDSEKQQLFDALAKEGKRWNAKTKTLEELPSKCEFKPMDWCLMRDVGEIENKLVATSEWVLCQFSHYLGDYKVASVGGNWFSECIPYNEQTKHLLGTTDDYEEGGEERK